jgi:hypothetical protein
MAVAMPKRMRLFLGGLAWMVVACSSGDASAPQDVARDSGADPSDSSTPSDSASSDGASDAGGDAAVDAAILPAPRCAAGDRTEWSGTIPNTVIRVAVCSACGESYVVAANGSASPASVTLDNGTTTLTTNVSSKGTATSAKIADNASDGTIAVCGTSGTHGCLAAPPQNQKYCNPFRAITSLRAERIDQGVDYGGSGPIHAIGPGTIDVYRNRNDTGWPGGTFVSYKLTAGPAAGKTIFLAENIDLNPALHSGSVVYAGTVVGTLVNASPDCEIGWGVAGAGYTAEHSCYVEGCTTPLGANFNQLLVSVKTPSGITNAGGCCPAVAGYPNDWGTLLAAWQ